MATREASYDLEIVEGLPHETVSPGYSPLEDQLSKIVHNPENHAPRWARIGRYNKAPAANSAKAVLLKRHGDTAQVEGWRFATRRIDGGEATGLFAQYDPDKVVPGLREQNKERYREYQERQREAAAQARARREAEKVS